VSLVDELHISTNSVTFVPADPILGSDPFKKSVNVFIVTHSLLFTYLHGSEDLFLNYLGLAYIFFKVLASYCYQNCNRALLFLVFIMACFFFHAEGFVGLQIIEESCLIGTEFMFLFIIL
jgi:hypothetical protein